MFGDWDWNGDRTCTQQARLENWLASAGTSRMVIIECGAGTAIPTVRHFCESIARQAPATLIRINLREPEVPNGQVGLAMGACEALSAIDELVGAGEQTNRKDAQ
jgi:hypothetical protein